MYIKIIVGLQKVVVSLTGKPVARTGNLPTNRIKTNMVLIVCFLENSTIACCLKQGHSVQILGDKVHLK